MMLLVITIVEPQEIVKPVMRADGIGVGIARLRIIVFQISLRVAEYPAQKVRRKIEKDEIMPVDQNQDEPEGAKRDRLRDRLQHIRATMSYAHPEHRDNFDAEETEQA